jgi:hypothetical protein
VFVVEGEKDADALATIGVLATTCAGGAGKWTDAHSAMLQGRDVVILPDNDEPGRRDSQQKARSLYGVAKGVRVVELPNLPPKGDASDWLDADGTAEALAGLIAEAPTWKPESQIELMSCPGASLAPEFPLDALPPRVRSYVKAAAESLNVPPEMVAVPFLGLAGALIGNRLHVALKTSWREYPSLYIAIVAPPGAAKTPALNLARWPLDAMQGEAIDDFRRRLAAFDDEMEGSKNEGKKRGDPKPEKPKLRHYFSTDPTIE